MYNKQQVGGNQTILSISTAQTKDKTNTNHEASSCVERTRENEDISPPVQPKGRRDMYMLLQRSNSGSSAVPLREDQHTSRVPETANKSKTKLDGNRTRTYIQTYGSVL